MFHVSTPTVRRSLLMCEQIRARSRVKRSSVHALFGRACAALSAQASQFQPSRDPASRYPMCSTGVDIAVLYCVARPMATPFVTPPIVFIRKPSSHQGISIQQYSGRNECCTRACPERFKRLRCHDRFEKCSACR